MTPATSGILHDINSSIESLGNIVVILEKRLDDQQKQLDAIQKQGEAFFKRETRRQYESDYL